ncbi:DUF5801 domain-containing protein [Sphingomonas sp. SM33]|uniref:DUF5801 domain-containing protein n=1 Tax=Sphingomonas telluris TaxID=2907998 RepID=A0ABS9VP89_9SPHN|nr:DUF5801 repeats-in-toxin domain-containing protein [Sphingomonas telluris]MCH8616324.1 DUF5801 domain-containing protein [Sphingomonas telluris]
MSLTISNAILDEEFRATQLGTADDNDVAVATFDASSFKTAVNALSLNLLSSPTGFPQFAEKTNFVSSTNQVTNYFLTSSATGTPFPAGGTATSLYVGSNQVYLFATSNPDIVVGRVGNGTTANPSGSVAIVIGIDEHVTAGVVTSADLWLIQRAPLIEDGLNQVDSADTLDLTNLVYLGSDYATSTEVPFDNYGKVPSGQDAFALVAPTSGNSTVDLLLTGFNGSAVSTVNVSTTGLGSGAQHVDEGESLRVDVVDANATNFSNADDPNEVHDESYLGYAGGHKDVVNATFAISQINPTNVVATVSVFAYRTTTNDQGTGFNQNAINAPGSVVQIDVDDVKILNAAGGDITATFLSRGGTIALDPNNANGVKISGLLVNEQVKFTPDGQLFNRFVVTNSDATSGPDAFDVGKIKVTTLVGGSATEYGELGSHIIYEDDGPKITASGATISALVADDSTLGTDPTGSFASLFNAPDYGADVPASSTLAYTLGISGTGAATGLTETSSGDAIFLFLESGKVVGRSGDTALLAAGGPVVFEMSVDANGVVKLDEKSAVVHPTNPDQDESTSAMTASLITLTASVTDSEAASANDSASANVDIGDLFKFKDDGPKIDPSANVNTPNDLQVANKTDSTGQDTSNYVLTPGNDGLKSFIIKGPADSSGDFTWQYFDVDGVNGAENNEIKGFYKGSPLYTLELNNDGTYTFKMIGTLPSSTENLGTTIIHAGGPTDTVDVQAAAPSTDFGRIIADSAVGAGLVNASHGFVGVDNGNLDNGEELNLSLHKANGDLISVTGINVGTKSAGTCHYDVFVTINGVETQVLNDVAVGKNGVIHVDDPNPNDNFLIQSVSIVKVDGNAVKIGLGDIQFLLPPNDVQLGFTVEEKDGDNDPVTANFTVDIDGNNDGTYSATVNALSAINPLTALHQDHLLM